MTTDKDGALHSLTCTPLSLITHFSLPGAPHLPRLSRFANLALNISYEMGGKSPQGEDAGTSYEYAIEG